MIDVIAIVFLGAAMSESAVGSGAEIEMRCGAQHERPSDIVACLETATQASMDELGQTQRRLFEHLAKIREIYSRLGPINIENLRTARQRADERWSQAVDARCEFYLQLHGAIGEGELEKAACLLRATKTRYEEAVADETFWREKFPVD